VDCTSRLRAAGADVIERDYFLVYEAVWLLTWLDLVKCFISALLVAGYVEYLL
jgi:hypothetical protein